MIVKTNFIRFSDKDINILTQMGVNFMNFCQPLTHMDLAKLVFEAGEESGRKKFQKELKNLLGVREIV